MSVFETATITPERLRTELSAWLRACDLDRGVFYYTDRHWSVERGETVGAGAALHLNIESSSLFTILNDYGATSTEEELDAFLAERGFYGELGFTWSYHVSRLD